MNTELCHCCCRGPSFEYDTYVTVAAVDIATGTPLWWVDDYGLPGLGISSSTLASLVTCNGRFVGDMVFSTSGSQRAYVSRHISGYTVNYLEPYSMFSTYTTDTLRSFPSLDRWYYARFRTGLSDPIAYIQSLASTDGPSQPEWTLSVPSGGNMRSYSTFPTQNGDLYFAEVYQTTYAIGIRRINSVGEISSVPLNNVTHSHSGGGISEAIIASDAGWSGNGRNVVQVTDAGDWYVAGTDSGATDWWIEKFDSTDTLQWSTAFSGHVDTTGATQLKRVCVCDDTVVVYGWLSGSWYLFAFDLNTGAYKWRRSESYFGSVTTRVFPGTDYIVVYDSSGTYHLDAYETVDGTQRWTVTPSYVVNDWYHDASSGLAVSRVASASPRRFTAYDPSDGSEVWTHTYDFSFYKRADAADGVFYISGVRKLRSSMPW